MMTPRALHERTRVSSLFNVDWFLLGAALIIALLGLATMHSYSVENAYF